MKKRNLLKALPTTSRLERVALSDLIPHPDQEKYFRKYGAYEYQSLKSDIAKNGLRTAIDVLPPGNAAGLAPYTIIAGHTRCKILIELGNDKTDANVRYDLASAKREIIDEMFIIDNVARRQQDRLGQARAAKGLYEIERLKKGRSIFGDELQHEELRDRIGNIIGMSGRNLQRYLNILAAPVEIQDAFDAGKTSLVQASRVSTLSRSDIETLSSRLRSGEDAKAVFAEYLPSRAKQHVKPSDALASFARSIERAMLDLADRVERVPAGHVHHRNQILRQGEELIRSLLARQVNYVESPRLRPLRKTGN